MKEVISTDKGPKAMGPYSQAIRANGFIFISGQGAVDPATGQLIEGDTARQTARTLDNLKAIVEAAGSSLDHGGSGAVAQGFTSGNRFDCARLKLKEDQTGHHEGTRQRQETERRQQRKISCYALVCHRCCTQLRPC